MVSGLRVEDRLVGAENFSPWKARIVLLLKENEIWDVVHQTTANPIVIPAEADVVAYAAFLLDKGCESTAYYSRCGKGSCDSTHPGEGKGLRDVGSIDCTLSEFECKSENGTKRKVEKHPDGQR